MRSKQCYEILTGGSCLQVSQSLRSLEVSKIYQNQIKSFFLTWSEELISKWKSSYFLITWFDFTQCPVLIKRNIMSVISRAESAVFRKTPPRDKKSLLLCFLGGGQMYLGFCIHKVFLSRIPRPSWDCLPQTHNFNYFCLSTSIGFPQKQK